MKALLRCVPIIVSVIVAASCGQSPSTVAPTPTPMPPVVVQPAPVTFVASGVVAERTATGLQPVADVEVGLYKWNEDALTPEALLVSTRTGPDGRYTLEGDQEATWIGAAKAGYRYYAERIGPQAQEPFDIELVPVR